METYVYECLKCHHTQEKTHKRGARPIVWCDRGCEYMCVRFKEDNENE